MEKSFGVRSDSKVPLPTSNVSYESCFSQHISLSFSEKLKGKISRRRKDNKTEVKNLFFKIAFVLQLRFSIVLLFLK